MKKKYLVVTGGAGFIGSNLINSLLRYKKFHIIILDNYSSGSKSNHLVNKRLKYIKAETSNINKVLHKLSVTVSV